MRRRALVALLALVAGVAAAVPFASPSAPPDRTAAMHLAPVPKPRPANFGHFWS